MLQHNTTPRPGVAIYCEACEHVIVFDDTCFLPDSVCPVCDGVTLRISAHLVPSGARQSRYSRNITLTHWKNSSGSTVLL